LMWLLECCFWCSKLWRRVMLVTCADIFLRSAGKCLSSHATKYNPPDTRHSHHQANKMTKRKSEREKIIGKIDHRTWNNF
jgi:hypothetical protein